jgi:Nitrile hydratase, alpha chain
MVREPRKLLAEMCCDVPEDVEIRVWDSSAEVRTSCCRSGRPAPTVPARRNSRRPSPVTP